MKYWKKGYRDGYSGRAKADRKTIIKHGAQAWKAYSGGYRKGKAARQAEHGELSSGAVAAAQATRATGIDISKWDVSFNPQSTTTPPQFVIQCASYGMVKDPLFDTLYPGVTLIPVRGAYHYMSSAAGWKLQADWFLNIVTDKGYHFYVCDFEGTFNQLSVDFAAQAVEWMRYVKAMTGKPVIIYSNISTYHDYLSKDSRTKEFPFWIAWPPDPIPDPQTANPKLPTSRKDWIFWQYSFGEHNTFGKANGVGRTGCDVDVFNGTYNDLCTWAGVPNVPPPAEPLDADKLKILWREAGVHGWDLTLPSTIRTATLQKGKRSQKYNGRYAPDQFYRGQFLVRLNHFTLCMNPHGFNRVEPRAFPWQKKGQQANALPVLFHGTIMITDPLTNCLAFVPGSMIPDHNQNLFICQPRLH
jgi:GH25 family lysozyme M1 (1,4-beta-N-acetylmuramidase)